MAYLRNNEPYLVGRVVTDGDILICAQRETLDEAKRIKRVFEENDKRENNEHEYIILKIEKIDK